MIADKLHLTKIIVRKYIIIVLYISVLSCVSTKKPTDNTSLYREKTDSCPAEGTCHLVLHKNKKLLVKSDELGFKYYLLEDNFSTSVIAFQYKKNTDNTLQDANYSEELLFEIQNSTNELTLKNEELQKTNMLFGRHCYCKGQAGYFSVSVGSLALKRENNSYLLSLQFKVNQVPQIVESISGIIP